MRGRCPIVRTDQPRVYQTTNCIDAVLWTLRSQVLGRDITRITSRFFVWHRSLTSSYPHFSLRQEKFVILLGEIYFHFSLRPLQMPVVDELAAFSAAYFSKCKVQSQTQRTKVCMDSKGTCTNIVIRVESWKFMHLHQACHFFFLWRLSGNPYSNTPGYICQSNLVSRPLFKEERGVWRI